MFHDNPRQTLCALITQYGTSLCDDRLRCVGLLRDSCSSYKGEISVLMAALDEGVATALRSSTPGNPAEILLGQLTQRLQHDRGLSEEAARWAVESWALALGVMSRTSVDPLLVAPSRPSSSTSMPPSGQPYPPPSSTPPSHSPGSTVSTPQPKSKILPFVLIAGLIGMGMFFFLNHQNGDLLGTKYRSGAEADGAVSLEAQRKAEIERQARLEAERNVEAERQARLEAERKVAAERQARLEVEYKGEADRQARLEAERKAAAERQARLEAERKVAAERQYARQFAPTWKEPDMSFPLTGHSEVAIVRPAFSPGTPYERIRERLGEPERITSGLWNTTAWIYDNFHLSYLLDKQTGQIRQSEIVFPLTAMLEEITAALSTMTNTTSISREVDKRIRTVFDGQQEKVRITLGNFYVQLERQDNDRFYLGVWDKNLKR